MNYTDRRKRLDKIGFNLLGTAGNVQSVAGMLIVTAKNTATAEEIQDTARTAVEAGAPVVELDFRQTSDGELVVVHDKTLDRPTNCRAVWQRQHVLASPLGVTARRFVRAAQILRAVIFPIDDCPLTARTNGPGRAIMDPFGTFPRSRRLVSALR